MAQGRPVQECAMSGATPGGVITTSARRVASSGVDLVCEVGAQFGGAGDRGGQADRHEVGREPAQTGEVERQQIAALGGGKGVQLVENDGIECAEQVGRVFVAEQQGELLGRRHQDVGRRRDAAAGVWRRTCRRSGSRT